MFYLGYETSIEETLIQMRNQTLDGSESNADGIVIGRQDMDAYFVW